MAYRLFPRRKGLYFTRNSSLHLSYLFFDCINDKTVAHALLDKAKSYATARGFNKIIGPTNYSTNETAGTLINGFNESPKIMMTYNASYYQSLLESYGLVKEIDLYAYLLPVESVSKKSLKLADAFEQRLERKGITIRKIRKKDIVKEAAGLKIIYNSAWEDNWGFVPFTDAEFEFLRNDLKMLVDEDFTFAGFGEDCDIEWRIANEGFSFLNLKHHAIQFHLDHERANREEETAISRQMFERKKGDGFSFCKKGLY